MLKDAQSLISENNKHCTESKKEEEKSRYKVSNLKLLDFWYVKVLKKTFCFAIRVTSRVHKTLQILIIPKKF